MTDPVLGAALVDPRLNGAIVTVEPIGIELGAGQGLAGPSATDILVVADQDLGGQRAVLWRSRGIVYADPAIANTAMDVLGITTGAARAGQQVGVRVIGPMTDPSFALQPGLPLYLGPNGALTQVPPQAPDAAVEVKLGTVLTPTTILIRIRQPLMLAQG